MGNMIYRENRRSLIQTKRIPHSNNKPTCIIKCSKTEMPNDNEQLIISKKNNSYCNSYCWSLQDMRLSSILHQSVFSIEILRTIPTMMFKMYLHVILQLVLILEPALAYATLIWCLTAFYP